MKKITLFTVAISLLLLTTHVYAQINFLQRGSNLHGENINDSFGYSPAINGTGNIIAAGAPYYSVDYALRGQVKVFKYENNDWVQLGSDILGADAEDGLGWSLSLNKAGDILAVGVPYNQDAGSNYGKVMVFKYVDNEWQQLGNTIYGESDGDLAGWSVELNETGYTVAIGAVEVVTDDFENGLIRVYDYNPETETWEKFGADLLGNTIESYFGYSLDLNNSGTIVAAGGPADNTNGTQAGIVKIFKRSGDHWEQMGDEITGTPISQLGWSLSFNGEGNTIAIGANIANNKNGEVKVFSFENGQWQQLGNVIEGDDNWAGYSVALNEAGNKLAVGFSGDKSQGPETGAFKVFELNQNNWQQIGPTLYGENSYDLYGSGTEFNSSGDIFVVAARNSSMYGNTKGLVQVYEITNTTGINHNLEGHISVSPIPCHSHLNISCKNPINEIALFNLNGIKLIEKSFNHDIYKTNLQLPNLPNGIYFLKVTDASKQVIMQKIIKQ